MNVRVPFVRFRYPSSVMAPLLPRWGSVAVLVAGPWVTAWSMAALLAGADPAAARWVAAAAWSPLPVTFPALLLQDARDAVVAPRRLRPLVLLPALCGRRSPVRVEAVASVAGFAVYVAAAVTGVGVPQ